MHIAASAIVCAVRAHGEHGVIVRALTPDAGLVAGYVRGGRSRRMRPILVPGNAVVIDMRARTDTQLGAMTVEMAHSRAPLFSQPLAAAAIDWVTVLTTTALPEGQAYPSIYAALGALLDAIELAPAASGWAGTIARYELLLLQALGFGLSMDRCTVTGSAVDLDYVSPKSAASVSRAAAVGYEARLLPSPAFLRDGTPASVADVLIGLELTGYFLTRRIFDHRQEALLSVRDRLVDRLSRAA